MKRLAEFAFPALCTLAVGCMGVGIGSEQFDDGIVYHLPRTILTISVTQYNDRAAGRTWYQIGAPKSATADQPVLLDTTIISATVPDPGHRYVAKYSPNPMSDDRLCVSRSPTGLLRDLNFASDDRTPEIAFNIARFIAGSLGGEKRTGITTFEEGAEKPVVRTYTGKLDPLNKTEAQAFNRAMKEVFGEDIEIDFGRLRHLFDKHTAKLPSGCLLGMRCPAEVWTDRCSSDRVCYRTQLTVPVDLMRGGKRVDVSYAKVINPQDIGAISITRAFLVQKISKFRFDDGVLIGAVIRKPSEVEELTLLPLHIIYAALATPSQALATAFGGPQADKIFVANKLGELSGSIKTSEEKIQQLRAALMGTDIVSGQDQSVYELQCMTPPPTGNIINIVTGAKL